MKLDFQSDNLIRLKGPTDEALQTPITGATVTLRVYDAASHGEVAVLATRLTASAAAAATVLAVESNAFFASPQAIELELDDGTLFSTTIASVAGTTTITLSAGLPSAASAFRRLLRPLHATGSTVLVLGQGQGLRFQIADTVEVLQNDLSRHVTTVSNRGTDHVLLAAATTQPVGVAQRLRRKLGGDIAMAQYGTPVANDDTWGYQGTVPENHAGLLPGLSVDLEISLSSGAIQLVETLHAVVL